MKHTKDDGLTGRKKGRQRLKKVELIFLAFYLKKKVKSWFMMSH